MATGKRVQLVDVVQTPCPQSTDFLILLLLFLKFNFIFGFPQPKPNPCLFGSDRQRICLQCRRPRFIGKIPWRRQWKPTPVFLPAESHGQRIIALQWCVSFCCTATWISYMYTYIPSLLDVPHPTPVPSHPSRSSQSTGLSPLCHTTASYLRIFLCTPALHSSPNLLPWKTLLQLEASLSQTRTLRVSGLLALRAFTLELNLESRLALWMWEINGNFSFRDWAKWDEMTCSLSTQQVENAGLKRLRSEFLLSFLFQHPSVDRAELWGPLAEGQVGKLPAQRTWSFGFWLYFLLSRRNYLFLLGNLKEPKIQ